MKHPLIAAVCCLLTISGLSRLEAAPANDNLANATTLPFLLPINVNGTVVEATLENDEPAASWGGWDKSVWWKWRCDRTGPLWIRTTNPTLDVALAVFVKENDELLFAAYSQDEDFPTLTNPSLSFYGEAGVTYWFCVLADEFTSGIFRFAISRLPEGPANDNFENAAVLGSELPATASGNNQDASVETFEPFHDDAIPGHSVWWQWTAPVSTNVIVATTGSLFDTVVAVYTGSEVGWLEPVASNDDAGGLFTSAARFRAVAGTTYWIAVDGYGNAAGNINLSVVVEPPNPAPAWSLPDLNGNMISSSQYAGQVVVVNFWATWCPPCREEIPDFIELQNQYGPEGLAFVGISLDVDANYRTTVRNFAAAYGINYDVVYDHDSVVSELFGGTDAIPTTFIIDRQGNIVERLVGSRSRSEFERLVLPLLSATVITTPPALAVSVAEGMLTLSWIDTADAFVLRRASALNGDWQPVPGTPAVVDGARQMTSPLESGGFFRLDQR
ncbi:MAG TPA: TlpA disulfide reductase family protein [Verrucomicrobiota bacterium]|nr:hypothetical protein [Verrucomicrobiales bacterium]HRI14392.1 TlpA disulfide reductase family protein [Verrucomicrobiota bacterium]